MIECSERYTVMNAAPFSRRIKFLQLIVCPFRPKWELEWTLVNARAMLISTLWIPFDTIL